MPSIKIIAIAATLLITVGCESTNNNPKAGLNNKPKVAKKIRYKKQYHSNCKTIQRNLTAPWVGRGYWCVPKK